MKQHFQAPWKAKDLFIIISTILVLGLASILMARQGSFEYSSNSVLLTVLIQGAILLLPIIVLSKNRTNLFALKKMSVLQTLKLGIGAYLGFILINLLIRLSILYSGIEIPGYQFQNELLPLPSLDSQNLWTMGLAVVVIAPVIEELFFRGFLFRALSNNIGLRYGSILSALIFTLLHGQFGSVIPLFIIGLILNQLTYKTKSIYPSIVLHMINNGIALWITILISTGKITIETFI